MWAKSPAKQGLLQALVLSFYFLLIGTFFYNAPNIFPDINRYLAPVFMLALFSTSALLCGIVVFYSPYKLFLSGKRKEAMQVVVNTAGFLIFFLAIIIALIFKFPSLR